MDLSLPAIRTDGGTQPRAGYDMTVVAEYAERMEAGAQFPPVTVFYDGAAYWLADGFHRVAAARRLDRLTIAADVRQGTQAEAQWYSYSVNATHGLRRTREDARRQIEAALRHPAGAGMSDRQIAQHVGVDHKTVGRIRASMTSTGEFPQSTQRTGTDGRTINTANIGRKPAAATAVPVDEIEVVDVDERDLSADDDGATADDDGATAADGKAVVDRAIVDRAIVEATANGRYNDLRSWLTRNYKPDAWLGILTHGKVPAWMNGDPGYARAIRRLAGELQAEQDANVQRLKADLDARTVASAPSTPNQPQSQSPTVALAAGKTVAEIVPAIRMWMADLSTDSQIAVLQEVERRTAEGSRTINQIMDEADLGDVRLSTMWAACQSILNGLRSVERANGANGANGNGGVGSYAPYQFVAVTDPADLLAIDEAVETLRALRKDIENVYAVFNILAKQRGFYLNGTEDRYYAWAGRADVSLACARRAADRVWEMALAAKEQGEVAA